MEEINFFETTTCNNYQLIEVDSNDTTVYIYPLDNIKRKIHSLTLLEDNWDGYGGLPLLVSISEKTILFVPLLNSIYIDSISDIFPNPNGTLTIDWENIKNEKLSLEIGENTYSFFVKYADKEPEFINGEDITQDIKILAEKLGELFSESFFNYISG
jgi:hypothetical protein